MRARLQPGVLGAKQSLYKAKAQVTSHSFPTTDACAGSYLWDAKNPELWESTTL